jgi:hypothetical protein
VAIGESGCNPAACYDDTTGQECTPASTSRSHDSIDRGVCQINSRAWPQVGNSCAFRGLGSAKVACGQVSADGSFFGPWTVYLTDRRSGWRTAAPAQPASSGRPRPARSARLAGSGQAWFRP